MDYRTGKCSGCGAEYKVPASFAHDAARCKVCKGVVHLGPAPGAGAPAPASQAVPAKRVVPKPAEPASAGPEPVEAGSAGSKKGGTLERLKRERAAQAAAAAQSEAAPARPAAAKPAPRPAAPKPASARAASDDEGGKSRSAGSRSSRRSAKERVRASTEERASARRERKRNKDTQKRKTPVAGILSGVALVLIVAVVYFMRDSLFGSGDGEGEAVAAAESQAPAETAPEAAPEASTPAPEASAPEPEPEPVKEEPAAPKAKDPASVDLEAYADFGPTKDTSADEWAEMQEQMSTWMDIDAGAAGNRAKLALINEGRRAVPVILNAFKRLDFATEEGRSNGDQCQKALMQIANGINYDWKYADPANGVPYDDPNDVYFCKRVAELWIKSWQQVETSIEAWIRLAKLEEKDPAEARRLRETLGAPGAQEKAAVEDDLEVD